MRNLRSIITESVVSEIDSDLFITIHFTIQIDGT